MSYAKPLLKSSLPVLNLGACGSIASACQLMLLLATVVFGAPLLPARGWGNFLMEILRPSTLSWELDTILPLDGSPFPMYLQLMNLIFINDVYFSVDFFNVGVIC